MPKRFCVFLIAVAAAIPAGAASDETCTRNVIVERRPLLAKPAAEAAAAPLVLPEGVELLVARIGPDGKPVLACVEGVEAAKKFLSSPIEKLARGAKEK